MTGVRPAAVLIVMLTFASPPMRANDASVALRNRAAHELLELDGDRAIASYREAIAADAQDAGAYRGLASALLGRIGMLRGTMTVDSYLGRIGNRDVKLPSPPAEITREFHQSIDRAIALARARVAARPRDAQAHYDLGAALGIRASYLATVDGGVMAAIGAARDAFKAHETVLGLEPKRADAGLIVGTYRYLVATMSLPRRLFAYMAGFGGGRERGIQLVEGAAAFPGDNQADARLALVLLYTREARFDAAKQELDLLRARYPRNRLLLLEQGSTLLRANRPAEAEAVLSEGLRMLERDSRPKMFGEDALWYYRRGAARFAQGRKTDARADLERALASQGRQWVHGRAHLELGRLAIADSDPQRAQTHLQSAAQLGDSDRDGASAATARELLRTIRPLKK